LGIDLLLYDIMFRMKVKDVMSRDVVTVGPETTFKEIGNIIFGKTFRHKFSSVPVIDKNNKLLGIVTEKDLLRRLYPSQKELIEDFFQASNFSNMEEKIHDVEKLTAQVIMVKNPITTSPETPLMRAGSIMLAESKRRLPVMDKNDKLVGIISQGDVFRTVFAHLRKRHR